MQGVTEVSVLGQLSASLLDQVLRRLRLHAEHQSRFTVNEDVLLRGSHAQGSPLREEDVLRVRQTTIDDEIEWSVNAYTRPLPVRENPDILIRNVASTPILEGDARSFAVALGYSDRRFTYCRKGHLFSLAGGLTAVQVFQLFPSSASTEALDPSTWVLEVISPMATSPAAQSTAPPMQTLRENAIQRTMDVKHVLKGLVDLSRVE